MSDDAEKIQKIIDYCNGKWVEAAESTTPWPTADMLTGKKMAYNEVLQFARTLQNG